MSPHSQSNGMDSSHKQEVKQNVVKELNFDQFAKSILAEPKG